MLDELKTQLRDAQGAETQHANTYQDAIEAKDQLNETQTRVKVQLDAATKEVDEAETKIEKAQARINKLTEVRRKALHEKNLAINMVEDYRKERDALEARRAAKQQNLNEDLIPGASQVCARVEVERGMNPKKIDDKLEALGQEQKRFESR